MSKSGLLGMLLPFRLPIQKSPILAFSVAALFFVWLQNLEMIVNHLNVKEIVMSKVSVIKKNYLQKESDDENCFQKSHFDTVRIQ